MSRYRPNAPPPRQGLRASCVVVPAGAHALALDFLAARFAKVSRADWQQRLDAGDIVDADTHTIRAYTPLRPGQRLYYFRSQPAEPSVPFQERIVWQDAHIVVADKPHFLPVIPSGNYVRETLLVRLCQTLDSPDLAPAHRIDRDTAGLVLFTRNPASRTLYHRLFRERLVQKTYLATARWHPDVACPLTHPFTQPFTAQPFTRHTRIAPGSHFMQQTEVPGLPNALTHIRVLRQHGPYALFELHPVTGQRHQLRVHMNALGLPLLYDGIYPTLTPQGVDYRRPLQLLAQKLAFTDPVSGEPRQFESSFSLLPLENLPP